MYLLLYVKENGVNLLTISAVNPTKYALQLMDILFSDFEMSSSCYVMSSWSSKPGLDSNKVTLMEGLEIFARTNYYVLSLKLQIV